METNKSFGYTYGTMYAENQNSFDRTEEVDKSGVEYKRNNTYYACISALFTIGIILLLIGASGIDYITNNIISFVNNNNNVNELTGSVTLKRVGYSPLAQFNNSSYLKYTFLQKYNAIIEPNANMTLHIDNGIFNNEHTYKLNACSLSENSCQTNSVVNFDCQPFDTFDISIDEFDFNDKQINSISINGMCMYVRRNIESLTETDLSDTMDAMYELWNLSEEDGQKKYGENFHSATYFTEAHHFNAGGRIADHIHEGLGFVTQHIKFSNMFEKSIQSVNPSVTLPYWEFTYESTVNKTIFDSIMFSKNTFGSIRKSTDSYWGFTYKNDEISDGSIKNGRWKKIKSDTNTKYSDIVNGYGLLRSPWNMNPSPYVTRFASSESSLPTCSDYYTLMQSSDVIGFLDTVQKGPHAPLHSALGNTFGCDSMDSMSELFESEKSQLQLCRMWSFYMKDLYRSHYIEPETGCNNDDFKENPNNQSCSYLCNSEKNDTFIDALKDKLDGKNYFKSDFNDSDWTTIRNFICSGDANKIVVGTHSDSSSPSDPSFWPVHPTQERLLHAYMIASNNGGWKWPTDSQTDYVCGTTKCIVGNDTIEKNYYQECCYGHYEYDQLIDYVTGDASKYIGESNHEILLATNPLLSSYSMPYIYDNFEWNHCSSIKGTTLTLDDYVKYIYINHYV